MTQQIEPSVTNGVPIEFIVDLCNVQGLSPWLDLSGIDASVAGPVVDDVRARLDPGLTLYVQHGDKVTQR